MRLPGRPWWGRRDGESGLSSRYTLRTPCHSTFAWCLRAEDTGAMRKARQAATKPSKRDGAARACPQSCKTRHTHESTLPEQQIPTIMRLCPIAARRPDKPAAQADTRGPPTLPRVQPDAVGPQPKCECCSAAASSLERPAARCRCPTRRCKEEKLHFFSLCASRHLGAALGSGYFSLSLALVSGNQPKVQVLILRPAKKSSSRLDGRPSRNIARYRGSALEASMARYEEQGFDAGWRCRGNLAIRAG